MLKSTGIVRQVDPLGRVVLPIELRRSMNVEPGTSLEIFTDGSEIVLKVYQPSCVFCGEARNVIDHKGKKICPSCIGEFREGKV